MARKRTISPDFWSDVKVGEVSVSARLLFIATWNFADDQGGLDRSAKQLKAQAFPYDNLDCEPLVQELLNLGLLVEYEVEGKKYLHIKGFEVHQKVENPSKARVPLYEKEGNIHRGLTEGSPRVSRGLGTGGSSPSLSPSPSPVLPLSRSPPLTPPSSSPIPPLSIDRPKTAKRIPEDFGLTPERRAVAEAEKANPEREFAMFRDHWLAASGANARKHNWDAAWRNWCRKASDYKPRANGSPASAPALTWRPPAEDEEEADVPH